uniref:Uncharacterized protein n=1 Tax=Arundo donax TaxID=35708 RepID=A0A0A9DIJ7_ARUDO
MRARVMIPNCPSPPSAPKKRSGRVVSEQVTTSPFPVTTSSS